ncbi:MAG TPA: hypothetical protein VGP08_13565 [Pyrinomonadaceae bacterium]|jgi:hypothetical protein|nr:hypothetical protein [Pyrinomonadaceae bacterium]
MSVIGNLIGELIDRNGVSLKGAGSVGLAEGTVKLSMDIRAVIEDKNNNNKPVARMLIPMRARVKLDEMVIPLRIPRQ